MNQLSKKINEGVSVYKNSHSPSGYTATFIYKPTQDIIKVSLTGPFFYIDPNMDLYDKDNIFTPHEYRNGMYASSLAPGTFQRNYIEDMIYDPELSIYRLDIPITSGAFPYSYIITYQDYTQETIDDPANPSPSKMNNQSYYKNASLKQSIVYGYYDKMKQSQSPYLDYVLPSKKKNGSLFFVKYEGNLSKNQDLGIYLPSNYNENTQPYKVIYASHGYTGNETDWFSMGNIHHIIDNLNEQVIVVTMENSSYELDFMKMYERIGMVEDNIINYIIPYIEKNYNVSKKASDRAFCGISMGAMITTYMYFDYPEYFGYFGAFSGFDSRAISQKCKKYIPVFYTTIGTCDTGSTAILANPNGVKIKYENFLEWNQQNQVENVIDGGHIPGAHDWSVWQISFMKFISEICWKK